jgi:hypothetical protein
MSLARYPGGRRQKSLAHLILFCAAFGQAVGWRIFPMRLRQKVVVAALLVCTAAVFPGRAQAQDGAKPAPHQKLTFQGDVALLTVAIKPDQTAAFEGIMTRVREALAKSPDPVRQRQAAGWKLMKIEKPMPDGNVAYVHVISPVVPDADYTVMQILYDAFPDERQALYETYRGAFAANLSLAAGRVAIDLGTAQANAVAAR